MFREFDKSVVVDYVHSGQRVSRSYAWSEAMMKNLPFAFAFLFVAACSNAQSELPQSDADVDRSVRDVSGDILPDTQDAGTDDGVELPVADGGRDGTRDDGNDQDSGTCLSKSRVECAAVDRCAFDGSACVDRGRLRREIGLWAESPFVGTAVNPGGESVGIRVSTIWQSGEIRGGVEVDGAFFVAQGRAQSDGVEFELGPCTDGCGANREQRYRFEAVYTGRQWVFTAAEPIGSCDDCLVPFRDSVFQPNDGIRPSGGDGDYDGPFEAFPSSAVISDGARCQLKLPPVVSTASLSCDGTTVDMTLVDGASFVSANKFALRFAIDGSDYVLVGTYGDRGAIAAFARHSGPLSATFEVSDVDPSSIEGMLFLDPKL